MFPAYPGFENLPLRVEVEWRGRKRPVVARLEQWPNSAKAVLVCDFEDEEAGERLVARGDAFWRPGTLHDWLCRYTVYNITTREPQSWSETGQIKLRFCLQHALASGKLSLAAIYAVRDAPAPNLVLVESDVSYWCCGLERSSFVPFQLMRKLAANAQDAQHQLYSAWSDRASDARFAWDWANSTDHKRLYLLTGYAGARHEVERAMKMILRNKSSLWETESCWRWNLGDGELSSESWSGADNELLEPWNRWVRNHYYPDLSPLLRREHPCVAEMWAERVRGVEVSVTGPPSMHEQLEAKLWLRDWLQDKASAEQTMTQIFNRGDETAKRRRLRAEMPPAERALWKHLRGEKLGCKFRRQTSVCAYVVDFYCARLKLAIEVDGESHVGDEAVEYDAKRQGEIEALGVEFLRFSNQQVYRELEGVVETIRLRVAELLAERENEVGVRLTPSVLRTSPPS